MPEYGWKKEAGREADKFEELPTQQVHPTNYLRHNPDRIGGTASTLRTLDAGSLLAVKLDERSSTEGVYYVGWAAIGSSTGAAIWRIMRITYTNTGSPAKDNLDIEWADGNAEFDNIYDNRESLTYS